MTTNARCPDCGEAVDDFDGHANFRDRGDGYCSLCGRTLDWHAATKCFCRYATGMPAPVPVAVQLTLTVRDYSRGAADA